MLKINVVNSHANLDILRGTENNIEKVEGKYKGHPARCVVFEDDESEIYYVARTLEDFIKNEHRQPPTIQEMQRELSIRVNTKASSALDILAIKYQIADKLGSLALLREEVREWSKDVVYSTLTKAKKSSHLNLYYPTISAFAKTESRTFQEEVSAIKAKQGEATMIASMTKTLQKKIFATKSKKEVKALDEYISKIEEIEQISDFITLVNKEQK